MGQGKRKVRGARHRVDWDDVLRTAFVCDLSQEEIVKMSQKERKAAREEEQRRREAPGYRRFDPEVDAAYKGWEKFRWEPGEIHIWFDYLESIGRRDLGHDITREDGYRCGRCHRDHDQPFYIPGEPLWLCRECACAAGQAQSGAYRLEWPKAKN